MATNILPAIGRAAAERDVFREHIAGCAECRRFLAQIATPLVLCATGEALWDAYQVAKLARRRDAVLNIAYNEAGEIISVVGLEEAALLALHNYLGTHVCGCTGPECGCVQYGIDLGHEQGREPLR